MYCRDQAGRSGTVHELPAQFSIVGLTACRDRCPPKEPESYLHRSGRGHHCFPELALCPQRLLLSASPQAARLGAGISGGRVKRAAGNQRGCIDPGRCGHEHLAVLIRVDHAAADLAPGELRVLPAEVLRNGADAPKGPVARVNFERGHLGSPFVGEPQLSYLQFGCHQNRGLK
jgi:hypothetical protein